MNSHLVRRLRASTLLGAVLGMAPMILGQDQEVSGNLFIAGDIEVDGNALSFGTRTDGSTAPGLALLYSDGVTSTLCFNATHLSTNWVWQRSGMPQLKLDSDNKLQLFDQSIVPVVKISLDPSGSSSFAEPVQFASNVTINGVLTLPNQNAATNASVLTFGLANQIYQRKDDSNIALGLDAFADVSLADNTAIGAAASATGGSATAIGPVACATGYRSTALGVGVTANSDYSTVIGSNLHDSGYNSVTIGTSDDSQVSGNVLLAPQGGNVGIGTTSPSFPLVVSGIGTYSGYGLNQIQVTSPGTEAGINLINTGPGGRSYNLFSTSDISGVGGGKFMIGDAAIGVSRLTINASGNVGLGIIDPTEKLEVAGNIKASGSVSAPTMTAGKIRVAESGDLSMGEFTAVPEGQPAPAF
ncbi:MAG: hypothetical protein JF599_02375 [Verrucomicrobia bacterium]|nr:hypothetical protein [Verrucomicrobiota bacterium]